MTRLCVAMITFNRADLLTETVESLKRGGHDYGFVLIDNGSTDAAARTVAAQYGAIRVEKGMTVGAAKNAAVTAALQVHRPDVVLISDDDYAYYPGALATLMQFMEGLPRDVILTGTTIEPLYGWNGVTGTIESGGVRALLRRTVPGGGWAFRAAHWPTIGGFPNQTWDEDTTVLRRLSAQGYSFAALPLAEHKGTVSLVGNHPPKGTPLNLQAYGVM